MTLLALKYIIHLVEERVAPPRQSPRPLPWPARGAAPPPPPSAGGESDDVVIAAGDPELRGERHLPGDPWGRSPGLREEQRQQQRGHFQ